MSRDPSPRDPVNDRWIASSPAFIDRWARAIGWDDFVARLESRGVSRRGLLLFGVAVFVPLLLSTGGALVLAGSFGVGGGVDEPAPTTEIDSCTTITEPGRYVLTADIVDDKTTHLSESCIRIEADDVVLDGDGHLVDGRGISGTVGVSVSSSGERSNVTITRLTVTDWDWGVYYDGVTRGEIREVTAKHNGAGISLDGTREVTVRNNEISDNGIGLFVLDASDNSIRHNTISDNLVGVDCDGAEANTFEANSLGPNRAAGSPPAC